jgi:hypothetical protein
MTEARIKTEHWVHAHLRRCAVEAVPAFVVRRGDNERGMVLLKINTLENGCRVLTQARDLDGLLGWLAVLDGAFVPESEADAYIARQTARDPDLWVVEIEDRQGRNWFEGAEI